MNKSWRYGVLVLVLLGVVVARPASAAKPTSEPLPRLETGMHTAPIRRIATDAKGRWAVTASEDKTVRVWEVATGKQLMVMRPPQEAGNEGKLYSVAMSPDGATIATGGWSQVHDNDIYLFDRASGRLLRTIPGQPNVINHLAWSPDGRWLAASIGANSGLRVFDSASGAEVGRDVDYGEQFYSAHFSSDSRRLVTSCFDGKLRLYAVDGGRLRLIKSGRPGGGERPNFARFSPDNRYIAVGFEDNRVVQVLDAGTLAEVARPSTVGVNNGNLLNVDWSADGRSLVAGGRWDVGGKCQVRRWPVGNWSQYRDIPLSNDTILDFARLPDGGLLFAAADPAWGVLDRDGRVLRRQDGVLVDLRDQRELLGLSANGQRVRFGFMRWGKEPKVFDVSSRSLGADDPQLASARTQAPGLKIENWINSTDPQLNGRPIKLETYEDARSLAITADGKHFVLGAGWYLRMYDDTGKLFWKRPAPGAVWAVNVSADSRFVVADYGDGTIRWHRFKDGEEVLAFFPHADKKRWVAWTPEGFYSASGPDAEALMGYHLNRGRDKEGEFVSAQQLREKYYQPGLISARLDADGDQRLAEAAAKLGDVRQILVGARAARPVVQLLSEPNVRSDGDVSVKVKVRDEGGGVGRLIYRIDGVELKGRPVGVAAGGTESRVFSLPKGRREITVTATNARGIESLPVRIVADIRPRQQAAPALHVLAVGITRYRDHQLEAGVRYAAEDAKTMGRLFREQGKHLYRTVDARVLINQEATGDNIRSTLSQLAGQMAPQDVFVLYLAGHGASFDREYHFIPWDAVYTSTAALRKKSLTNEQFRELLAKIPAAKTVILLDTCSSGGFGKQEGRGINEKDAIDRLSRLTGRAMIAATADDKMAIEGEGGHGAFTYALLEGLRGKADRNHNNSVEVRELADYVEEALPKITRKWGYEQFPFSSTEGSSFTLVPKR